MLSITSQSNVDIESLRSKHRDKEIKRLETYEDILKKCHAHICSKNDRDVDNTLFRVPKFQLGKPPIRNHEACLAYVIHNLRRNGFKVKFICPDVLFIVWRDEKPSLPNGIEASAFQACQPMAHETERSIVQKASPSRKKNKDDKLSDINRAIFKPMPKREDSAKLCSAYDDEAFRSLKSLTDRIKKRT